MIGQEDVAAGLDSGSSRIVAEVDQYLNELFDKAPTSSVLKPSTHTEASASTASPMHEVLKACTTIEDLETFIFKTMKFAISLSSLDLYVKDRFDSVKLADIRRKFSELTAKPNNDHGVV